MNISLPQTLKTWIDRQIKAKGYSTASEYVRDVLRREQEQEVRARVDQKLLAALGSGPPVEMTAAEWKEIRRKAKERSANKKRRK